MSLQKFFDNLIAATILPFIPKRMTPNQVTALRILALPFIFYLLTKESYGWGLAIFTIAALTDAVDGAMARKRDQITDLGKVLDAIADKGLIILVAVIFIPKFFGWGLLAAMIVLEILNSIGAHLSRKRTGVIPGANWAGKVKMVIQCVAFILLFLGIFASAPLLRAAEILLYASLPFNFLQAFLYPKQY